MIDLIGVTIICFGWYNCYLLQKQIPDIITITIICKTYLNFITIFNGISKLLQSSIIHFKYHCNLIEYTTTAVIIII